MDMDEHSLLDGSGMTVNFFVSNVKKVWVQWMSCCGAVLMDMGGCLEMYFDSIP